MYFKELFSRFDFTSVLFHFQMSGLCGKAKLDKPVVLPPVWHQPLPPNVANFFHGFTQDPASQQQPQPIPLLLQQHQEKQQQPLLMPGAGLFRPQQLQQPNGGLFLLHQGHPEGAVAASSLWQSVRVASAMLNVTRSSVILGHTL